MVTGGCIFSSLFVRVFGLSLLYRKKNGGRSYDTTLSAIVKYRNHPSVWTILDQYKNSSIYKISHVTKEEVLKEIGNLHTTKLSQDRYPDKSYQTKSGYFWIFYT